MMEDLYEKTDVIKLQDTDFTFDPNGTAKLTNKTFKNKDGYIMFYANWCPNCRSKVDFWSFLGKEFNKNKIYAKENFKIAAIDSDNPLAEKITRNMNVTYIPRFVHVNSKGELNDYKGQDYEPNSIMSEVCQQKHKLCNVKF